MEELMEMVECIKDNRQQTAEQGKVSDKGDCIDSVLLHIIKCG